MLEKIKERLEQLKGEYGTGQVMLADKERQISDLRETLLRIAGAIQIMEEEIAKMEAN